MNSQWVLCKIFRDLSPHTTILVLIPDGKEAIRALIAFERPEWTAPHKPRSDDIAIIKRFCCSTSLGSEAF